MPYAPKLVLKTPVSDWTLLKPFVEACVRDSVVLVAVVGPDPDEIEDLIDDILIDADIDSDRIFVTSSHPGETVEEVLEFASFWSASGEVQLVRL
ncbi:hypothetical protein BH10PSE3_BH10PSE3_25560 [soil metagenome]